MTQSIDLANAINSFVKGCKTDGTWDAIKACCIMAAWDGLDGALVPLKGPAPTNYNFVAGDYDRETGLVGDGSTKYLDSNRNNNADPQDNNHNAVFVSIAATTTSHLIGSHPLATQGGNSMYNATFPNSSGLFNRSDGSTLGSLPSDLTGLCGHARSTSSSYRARGKTTSATVNASSSVPASGNIFVFCRGTTPTLFSDARLSFYSIGESLGLALLDNRVSTLMTDIGAAIP